MRRRRSDTGQEMHQRQEDGRLRQVLHQEGPRCRERVGFMSRLTKMYSKCKLSETSCSI